MGALKTDHHNHNYDILRGSGIFAGLRKAEKEGQPDKFYVTLSKFNSPLTLRITEAQYSEMCAHEAKGEFLSPMGDVMFDYVCTVYAKPDAVHISRKESGDLNFVANSLDEPWLKNYRLVEVLAEVEDDFSF